MEDYAVVLANDLVVKASNFGNIANIKFNKQGKVVSFLYEGQQNIALFEFKSNEFLDYVEEKYFEKIKAIEIHKEGDKYDGVDKKLWEDFVFKKYNKLILAQFNDTIFGLLRDSSGLCYNYHTWLYTTSYKVPVNPQLAPNALPHGAACDTFAIGTHAKDFFDAYKNINFYDTNQNDTRLIGEIASLLKNAGEKTAEAFLNFNLTGVNTKVFTFHTSENGYSRTEFLEYKKGLELWLKMLKKYKLEISKLGHDEQLFIYIDIMYRHNMLTLLTVQQRVNILKILVEKRLLMNWYWSNFSIGFIHKEDLAIYILKSFTKNTDADEFLQKLISTNVIKSEYIDHQGVKNDTTYVSLYKMLFYRMDDYGGKDNFTVFVEELNRIVLLKNNIEKKEVPPKYTSEQLKTITKAQFVWREKRVKNGPNKDRRKYEIEYNTDKKIKIKETIFSKVKLQEKYYSSSVGTPILAGYEEVTTKTNVSYFELNHFDLVSIHFYDNPSFIDLTTDVTYVGRHYFTFAGFIDYILEKENTKVAEDIFNSALYLISLAVGFGEVIAAVRGINAIRALLGVVMISSDTGLYLSVNTPFRNYILAKYPDNYQEILDNLQLISTFLSLGTNIIAGSGILNQFSKAEATKFVGTAEAILKDSEALKTLSADEIIGLKEIVKKVKNELYIVRNEEEIIHIIVRTQAKVRINKYPVLKDELEKIFSKNLFYDTFYNIPEDFLINLKKNPEFIQHWDTLSEAEKVALSLEKLGYFKNWYQIKIENIAELRYKTPDFIDLKTKRPYSRHELISWADEEIQFESLFRKNIDGEAGDAIIISGPSQGKSIDFFGTPKEAFLSNSWKFKYDKSFEKLTQSIDRHFEKILFPQPGIPKLDIFVLDFRYYEFGPENLRNDVMNYLKNPNYHYNNMVNSQYFKIIN